jgi:chromosome segregation ATPase
MSDALAGAEATELGLREQISDLVHARARADAEAARLADRSTLDGAHDELAQIAGRYERQSQTLAAEIETLRSSLRAAEAELERLRAPGD